MFRRQNRLTSREFDTYFKQGVRTHSPIVTSVYTPNENLKVSVVVPKKVIKSAIGRNRLKRQLLHILKPQLEDFPGIYIFLVKKDILRFTKEDIVLELTKLIGRINKSG